MSRRPGTIGRRNHLHRSSRRTSIQDRRTSPISRGQNPRNRAQCRPGPIPTLRRPMPSHWHRYFRTAGKAEMRMTRIQQGANVRFNKKEVLERSLTSPSGTTAAGVCQRGNSIHPAIGNVAAPHTAAQQLKRPVRSRQSSRKRAVRKLNKGRAAAAAAGCGAPRLAERLSGREQRPRCSSIPNVPRR